MVLEFFDTAVIVLRIVVLHFSLYLKVNELESLIQKLHWVDIQDSIAHTAKETTINKTSIYLHSRLHTCMEQAVLL